MIVVAMAQLLLLFNITALKVSIDSIAESLGTPASTVKTAIVTYSLVVAGLIMPGTRIGQRFGVRRVFRATVALFGAGMAIMALSTGSLGLLLAQVLAGAASAALIPTLVVMIARHYHGNQQAKALGWLGGIQAMGIVPAFLIAGYLATSIEWRVTFGALVLFAAGLYLLSGKLRRVETRSHVHIDLVGVMLAAAAVLSIGIGFNQLTDWGPWRARPGAPFSVLSVSPAPLVIACGVVLLVAFLSWSRTCSARGRLPLIAPEVIHSQRERSAVLSIFAIGTIGAALTFLIPLYIEVVQGRNSLYTAIALAPFTLASFAAAIVVVRLHGRVSPRLITRYAFLVVAAGVALLGATVRNDWSDSMVVLSLIVTGFGEGALATLLFKLLVMTVPEKLAGDVGSLCGSTNYLGAGVGTALAGALVVGMLGSSVQRHLVENPIIPVELKMQVNLDSVSFVSNDQLLRTMAATTATPEQVAEAVRINTQARLDALKVSFFVLAGLALLAFVPAARVPEVPGRRLDHGAQPRDSAL